MSKAGGQLDLSTLPANRVLDILYNRLSGRHQSRRLLLDELSQAAGLSREQCSEVLDELQRRGHVLQQSPMHGVELCPPVRLDPYLIEQGLGTQRIGRSVICFDEVNSTNDIAMSSARQGDTDGLVVTAEKQQAGRGRHGRSWLSPAGSGLLFSVLLLDKPGVLKHEAMTIAAGLAVAEGIEQVCGLSCNLKWPNDVYYQQSKLSGILVETRQLGNQQATVVGVGINVTASPPPGQTSRPATHISLHASDVERNQLLRGVLQRLDFWLYKVMAGQYELLHDTWLPRCGMIHERVRIRCGDRCCEGRVLDVSPLEGLILACDSGQHMQLPAIRSSVLD